MSTEYARAMQGGQLGCSVTNQVSRPTVTANLEKLSSVLFDVSQSVQTLRGRLDRVTEPRPDKVTTLQSSNASTPIPPPRDLRDVVQELIVHATSINRQLIELHDSNVI